MVTSLKLTPFLVIGYRRPTLLEQTLSKLHEVDVRNIYIYLDSSPQSDGDLYLQTERCKDVVLDFAKSKPGVKINFAETHLGCFRGVKTAIDWFFSIEHAGVILEDDLKVSNEVPRIAEVLIRRFETDKSIGSISLYRNVGYGVTSPSSISLTRSPYPTSWGWITWRDRWSEFSEEFSTRINKFKMLHHYFNNGGLNGVRRWSSVSRNLSSGDLDSWAYRWLFTHWLKGWSTLVLPINQIENLGFDDLATHTKSGLSQKIEVGKLDYYQMGIADVDKFQKQVILKNTYGVPKLKETILRKLRKN